MTLTSDERSRFLASLREDAEFREEVRRQVLTAELLHLPERFAAFVEEMHAFVEEMHAFVEEMHAFVEEMHAFVDEMHAFVEEMHAFVEEMHASVAATNWRLDRLEIDSGKTRGMILEIRIFNNPGYYLSKHARRVKVVDLDDLLDHVGIHDMSDEQYDILARTDLFARGVSKHNQEPVLLVVEATWRVHSRDVDRQVARCEILRNHNIPAVAVIFSVEPPSQELERYAATNGVFVEAHERKDDAA